MEEHVNTECHDCMYVRMYEVYMCHNQSISNAFAAGNIDSQPLGESTQHIQNHNTD